MLLYLSVGAPCSSGLHRPSPASKMPQSMQKESDLQVLSSDTTGPQLSFWIIRWHSFNTYLWLKYYVPGTVIGTRPQWWAREGQSCSQCAASPGKVNRPLESSVIISSTELWECIAGGLAQTFEVRKGCQRKEPLSRDSSWGMCLCVHLCMCVHMCARRCLGDRVQQHPGTSWQAESIVHVRVGSERRHVGFQTLRHV